MENKKSYVGCWILVLFMLAAGKVCAQADEFATWSMVRLNHQLRNDLRLSGAVEFRSKDDLKMADRWGGEIGLMYTVLSWLKVEGVYEVHYRNLGEDKGWKFRHRYNLGAQGTVGCGNFKVSLRERFQQTFSGGEVENRLRSRLKISYALDKPKLSLYFAPELYQPIGDRAFFRVARMRYRPGVEITCSKRCALDVFYCRQYESDNSRNIFGVEVKVAL